MATSRARVRVRFRLAACLLLVCLSCGPRPGEQHVSPAPPSNQPAAHAGGGVPAFVGADGGQWTMAAKDYASARYSSLDQINASAD
jgi:glucose dehydrogenase